MKIRTVINEIENRKAVKNSNKIVSWFLGKKNKINIPLAKWMLKKEDSNYENRT